MLAKIASNLCGHVPNALLDIRYKLRRSRTDCIKVLTPTLQQQERAACQSNRAARPDVVAQIDKTYAVECQRLLGCGTGYVLASLTAMMIVLCMLLESRTSMTEVLDPAGGIDGSAAGWRWCLVTACSSRNTVT